jgi:leucyl aminopeptidase
MAGLYADKFNRNNLRISQSTGDPDARAIAGVDQILAILPERIPASAWRRLPQGSKLKALMRRRVQGRTPAITARLDNKRQTAIQLGTTSMSRSAFERLTFARKLLAAVNQEKPASVGIWILGFDAEDQAVLAREVVAAALAAAFVMPSFKKEQAPSPIRSLRLFGLERRVDLARAEAEAEGNNMARWLTAMPPNKLDAVEYAAVLSDLARENGWQYRKFGTAALEKKGAGAFLAVAQGNADDSACMIRLRYRPSAKKADPKLTLVGKGIIFDTGGNNLKPFNSMLDMHIDMGGSALAIGTLLTISRLGLDVPVDCWLAITENRIGPTAYKSQDVVTAANGKTIQTIHTDAEGRMALADALVLACADKPELLIDYATLTGACINAVTTRYCGVFTNDPNLHPVLKKAGRESGERVWPFPIGGEFLEELKSDTADIKQCSPDGGGDHILAATFLNEFVDEDVTWVHMDLSAALRKGGLAHIPTDITGFGVRFSMQLLLDKGLLEGKPAR